MAEIRTTSLHSVRVATTRAGLTPELLRAWEKRYQAVVPIRTPGGQRNYSDADIERLRLLVRATATGKQIGQIAQLNNAQLQGIIAADAKSKANLALINADDVMIATFFTDSLIAVEQFNAMSLERTLRTAVLRLSPEKVLDCVFGPLLLRIGTLWQEGKLPPANGHLATTTIQRVLTWITDFPNLSDNAPKIVVSTPTSQIHDLGALLVATAATANGWNATYLGASLPARELAHAARITKADTIALSIIYPRNDPLVIAELRTLRTELDPSTALVVGGSGAAAYKDVLCEIGAEQLNSIVEFRNWLWIRKKIATDRIIG